MARRASITVSLWCFYFCLAVSSTESTTQNLCGIDGYSSCGNGLPLNFCCPSGTTCLSVASNSTAICCPSGQDCSAIFPITCNIQQQNVTAFPKSVIKTTKLDESLPSCGSNCCPFGYRCNDNQDCELDDDPIVGTAGDSMTKTISTMMRSTTAFHYTSQTSQTSATATPSPSTTTINQPNLASATSVAASNFISPDDTISDKSSNRTNIAVGSIVGAAGAVSIVGGIAYLWRRRRRQKNNNNNNNNTLIEMERRGSWKQNPRPQHDSGLTKYRTWRGQSYYARADMKPIRISLKPLEHVHYAELPATPLPLSSWNMDFPSEPPVRSKTIHKTLMGTKPGKSQDRWSLQ